MIYEGYRDINEPGSIRISTAYNSKELAFPKPVSQALLTFLALL